MEHISFDSSKTLGGFKPMNAVNNGPYHKRNHADQPRDNLEAFTAAKIPFVRNHDASFNSEYGSEHTVDISAIFTNFDADPENPASYDFACTDEYIAVTNLSGAETYYRLGQRIEHYIKKFNTLPPKDFHKWAVICEHIIRHYTEGWANGYNYKITYWEIWNEPDIDPDDATNKRCWGGTKAQFFDFYEIAAKHLKGCFPHLKIGGPALAHDLEWAEDFLAEMQRREVPIDFFSWHRYTTRPQELAERAEIIRGMLDKYGYENAENINNEWNYVKAWEDYRFVESISTIIGMKGAAFTMACMSAAQKSSLDMLMYYDARLCAFNGLFDFYTLKPLKGYYPFLWFSELADLQEVRASDEPEDIYTLCGVGADGKATAIVTYYTDEDNMPEKKIALDFGKSGKYEVFALNEEQTNEKLGSFTELTFDMKPNTCLLIKEM